MKRLTASQYEALIAPARAVAHDDLGVSVYQLPDDRFVKVFRRQRLLSSDIVNPYAVRFVKAAQALKELGFCTVNADEAFRVPSERFSVVPYEGVPGRTVRNICSDHPADAVPEQHHARVIDEGLGARGPQPRRVAGELALYDHEHHRLALAA